MQQTKFERTYSENEVARIKKDLRISGICGGYLSGCFFGYMLANDFFDPLALVPALIGIALIFACGALGAAIVHYAGDACVYFSNAFDKGARRYGPVFYVVIFVLLPLIGIAIGLFAPGEG